MSYEISDEEFELAKADCIAKFGMIPDSLQRVIDSGGRFARPVGLGPRRIQEPGQTSGSESGAAG